MQEYRVFLIAPDGHIVNRVEVLCTDDEAARKRAELLVDDHSVVELWQRDRKLATFTGKS